MKLVKVVVTHSTAGLIRPGRFHIIEGDEQVVVNIEKFLNRSEEGSAKERELILSCQGVYGNSAKVFELKYQVQTYKWFVH